MVDKSSTASAPSRVCDDLVTHLNDKKIKLKPSSNNHADHIAYMVIDKDHFFNDTHVQNTRHALKYARVKNIEVICSAPSFDLWLLCHYLDIANLNNQEQQALYENRKASRHANSKIKQVLNQQRRGESMQLLLKRTELALINEKQLNPDHNQLPPECLKSNVGKILDKIKFFGIPLTSL